MHDYLFSIEVVRFAFLAGVVTSILLYERRHLTTGSIVVPGYIAVFMVQPLVLVATFTNAVVTYWMVNRLLPRWVLLYGRAKFTVLALISIGIQALMLALTPTGPHLWEAEVPLLVGAGYVVPALIAHDMARQGPRKTAVAVLLAGFLVAVPVGVAFLLNLPGVDAVAPLTGHEVMAIEPDWIPLAVLISAAAAWGLLRNHGLRAGGFVGAAYVGMLSGRPFHVLWVLAVAGLAYLLVSRFLMPRMILFGRRKFAAMMLVAALISWSSMWIGNRLFGIDITYYTTLSSIALTPLFVPGLLANDMHRSGILRVLAGAALGACFVVAATWSVQELVEGGLPLLWGPVALITGGVVFRDQVHQVGSAALRRFLAVLRGDGGRHRVPFEAIVASAAPARVGFPTSAPGRRLPAGTPPAARPEPAMTAAGDG